MSFPFPSSNDGRNPVLHRSPSGPGPSCPPSVSFPSTSAPMNTGIPYESGSYDVPGNGGLNNAPIPELPYVSTGSGYSVPDSMLDSPSGFRLYAGHDDNSNSQFDRSWNDAQSSHSGGQHQQPTYDHRQAGHHPVNQRYPPLNQSYRAPYQQSSNNDQVQIGRYDGQNQQYTHNEQTQVPHYEGHPPQPTYNEQAQVQIQRQQYDGQQQHPNMSEQVQPEGRYDGRQQQQQFNVDEQYDEPPRRDQHRDPNVNNQQQHHQNEQHDGSGEEAYNAQHNQTYDRDWQGSDAGHRRQYTLPSAPPVPSSFPSEVRNQINTMSQGGNDPEVALAQLRYTAKRRRDDDLESPPPSTTIPMGVGHKSHEAAEGDEDSDRYKNPPEIGLVMGDEWNVRLEAYFHSVVAVKTKYNWAIRDRHTMGQTLAVEDLNLRRKADVFALTRSIVDDLQFAIPASLILAGNASLETEFLKELMDKYNRTEHMCRIISAAFDIELDWKSFFGIPAPGTDAESGFQWEALSVSNLVVYQFYTCILAPSIQAACDFYVDTRNRSGSILCHYYSKRHLMSNVHHSWPIPGPTIRAIFNLGKSGTYLAAVNKKTILAKQAADFLEGEQLYGYVNGDIAHAMLQDMARNGDASIYGMHHLRHGILLITITLIINDVAMVSRWAVLRFLHGKNPFIPKENDFTPIVAVAGALTSMAFLDVKAEMHRTGQGNVAPSVAASTIYPLKQGGMAAYTEYLGRPGASEGEKTDLAWINTYCYTRAREAYLFTPSNFPLEDFAAIAWTPAAHMLSRNPDLTASRRSFLSHFHRDGQEESERRKHLPAFVIEENAKTCDYIVANNGGSIEAVTDGGYVPTSITNGAAVMRQDKFARSRLQVAQPSAGASSAPAIPSSSSTSTSTALRSAIMPSSSSAVASSSTAPSGYARETKRTRF